MKWLVEIVAVDALGARMSELEILYPPSMPPIVVAIDITRVILLWRHPRLGDNHDASL